MSLPDWLGTSMLAGLLAASAFSAGGCLSGGDGSDGEGSGGRSSASRVEGLVEVSTVSFRSSSGDGDAPALVAAPRAAPSRGCVFWQYGLGSTREESAKAWQAVASLGLTTVSVDLWAAGRPEETAPLTSSPRTVARLIREAVGRLRSAIDRLESSPHCRGRVAYAGVGHGGVVGTLLAATDKRVKAAVLMATPGTFRSVLTRRNARFLPGVAAGRGGRAAALRVLTPLDPARRVGRISPRPVLILSGLEDRTVPISSARRLQAAARDPKTIVEYAGGHDPASGPAAGSNGQAIASFLLREIVEPAYGISGNADGTFSLRSRRGGRSGR